MDEQKVEVQQDEKQETCVPVELAETDLEAVASGKQQSVAVVGGGRRRY